MAKLIVFSIKLAVKRRFTVAERVDLLFVYPPAILLMDIDAELVELELLAALLARGAVAWRKPHAAELREQDAGAGFAAVQSSFPEALPVARAAPVPRMGQHTDLQPAAVCERARVCV